MRRLVRENVKSVFLLVLLFIMVVSGRKLFSLSSSIDTPACMAIRTEYAAGDDLTAENVSNESGSDTEYIYRTFLSSEEQKVYNRVVASIEQYKEVVSVDEAINDGNLESIMTAIFNDHPELFWIDTKYRYNYTKDGQVVEIRLYYNIATADLEKCKEQFESSANRIIKQAKLYGDDLEKEKYVYGALQRMIYYNENADLNQSAYSALVNRVTVCAGYSRAFQYIMQQLEIPCYFCTGSVDSGMHAWNIVRINDAYYNVDLSWDDMLAENNTEPSYQYFNLTDREFMIEHHRSELSEKLPECN